MKMHSYPTFAVIVLVLSAALLAGCATGPLSRAPEPTEVPIVTNGNEVIAEGRVVPRDFAQLAFSAGGEITEVLVQEGDTVEAGQVLARLGDREQAEAALTTARLELLDAQQGLDSLNQKAGLAASQARQALADAEKQAIEANQALDDQDTEAAQDRIDDARQQMIDRRSELADAREEMEKYADLDSDNPNRTRAEDALENVQQNYNDAQREYDRLRNNLEQARAAVDQADAALEDARREYDARRSGPHVDDLALAQARLENAQAQVASAEAALGNMELQAPYAGTITRIDISAGERAAPGQVVFVLADFSAWYVETTDLTEMEVVQIDPDGTTQITIDALDDLDLSGTIESIGLGYQERAGDVIYTVRIHLNESDPRLRWGMTVQVRLPIE